MPNTYSVTGRLAQEFGLSATCRIAQRIRRNDDGDKEEVPY